VELAEKVLQRLQAGDVCLGSQTPGFARELQAVTQLFRPDTHGMEQPGVVGVASRLRSRNQAPGAPGESRGERALKRVAGRDSQGAARERGNLHHELISIGAVDLF
jgi:hypothetical protein